MKCRVCGLEMEGAHGNRKVCEACCVATCEVCGKTFPVSATRVGKARFCSWECMRSTLVNVDMRSDVSDGVLTNAEIASKYGVSRQRVHTLRKSMEVR